MEPNLCPTCWGTRLLWSRDVLAQVHPQVSRGKSLAVVSRGLVECLECADVLVRLPCCHQIKKTMPYLVSEPSRHGTIARHFPHGSKYPYNEESGFLHRRLYHIISHHIISYHIISYHIMPCHIISYHIMSCHVISYHIISYHIISYHIISYHIISYHIMVWAKYSMCKDLDPLGWGRSLVVELSTWILRVGPWIPRICKRHPLGLG